MSQIVPDRVNEQSPAPMDVSPSGHESGSVFTKVKNKAKKMRDKVKAQYDNRHDHKVEEEEESEEDEYQSVEKPDENVEGVTQGMAGLGVGAAEKDDRPNQESENVHKSSLKDLLGKDDGMSTDETMKPSESPVEPRREEYGISTEAKEDPKEDLSDFKETEPEKAQKETDVGTPSITQKAGVAMAGAAGGILGLGKGNKQEERGEDQEKPNSSEFDKPPSGLKEVGGEEKANSLEFEDAPVGLKEVPKPLEEEFQSLLEKSKVQQSEYGGEGNELSSDEKPKPTGEAESDGPEVTKKAPGLFEGLKGSFTSDQGKKDATVPEEQNQEDKGAQSYGEELYAAKNVISPKLGYGGPPSGEKPAIDESKGEDKLQDPKTEEEGAEKEETSNSTIFPNLSKSAIEDPRGEDREEAAFEDSKVEDKEEAGVEESKGEEKLQDPKTEDGTENKGKTKNTLVSKLSPGEDDKALSEVITEAFNSGARSILGGFYGGSPKAEVPPPPSSGNEGAAELPQSINPPQNSNASKGIVGRVTGVVSSFIGKKPKEDGGNISSPQAQDPKFGEHEEDLTGASETQTGNQIEQGTK